MSINLRRLDAGFVLRAAAGIALVVASGCASPETDPGGSLPGGLPPLAPVVAEDLTASLPLLETPGVQATCTADEIDFLRVSAILMAVYVSQERPGARPWTSSQRDRVDRLEARWEALGGDGRTVSEQCEGALDRAGG